jgi:cellulose synthase/poly-beta-1,6-N-acetylglucosamine synthase-like glycosyltransferase
MAGAFGALFAFRLNLFSPFPNGIMVDDLYVSLAIFKQKFKQVLIKSALAYEDVNGDSQIEFNRKVRIAIGSWQNMDYHADALMPPNNKLAYTFISHKLLRWLTPHALIILYPTLLFLGLRNNLFLILFLLFQASIILALIHVALKIFQIKLPILPSIAHFYHMNIALLLGFFKFLIGTKDQNTWTPTKRKTQN